MKPAWGRAPGSMCLRREIRPYECAPGGHPLPHVLAQIIQEAAATHADVLGIGMEAMERRGLFWVLGALAIRIAAMPSAGAVLTLETWPSTCSRLWAGREVRAAAGDGTLLFEAGTDWMLLRADTRRPVDMSRLDLYPPVAVRLCAELPPLGKPELPVPGSASCLVPVPVSALDINGHVNNTVYIRWAYDALYAAGYRPDVRALRLAFHNEACLDDIVRLDVLDTPEGLTVIGRKTSGAQQTGVPVFSAQFA